MNSVYKYTNGCGRWARVIVLSLAAAAVFPSCGDSVPDENTGTQDASSSADGGTELGDSGSEVEQHPCITGATGCVAGTVDTDGNAFVEIFFETETCTVISGSGSDVTGLQVNSSGDQASVAPRLAGDTFTDVLGDFYTNQVYILVEYNQFLSLRLRDSTGQDAPITIRVVGEPGGTDVVVEAAWGTYATESESDNGGGACDGSAVGDGTFDSCCTSHSDCLDDGELSGRCCLSESDCSFSEGNEYTCRRPR